MEMKIKNTLYAIVGIQFVIGIAMWFVSLSAPIAEQGIWGLLLSADLILSGLLLLIIMKHVAGV
ncbi:MAG: hypothetical protein KIY12_09205 [Thermoplasmata archaeon]|uniref:Uncharacterized protein n=1 Tax=Candidatus Sysuiplasma superficiale TaxID=2823368 RepID=A0A8J8CEQ9_9ARCH|nr:hypothetical protein [Candidatus Sysuiplasma superficiale]MBX8644877.1 hypothetical protein [Candidatus Sysuiplasma superficiale]MCL4347334.1 hypothetical protein [Candidatus Thermoplasmatota archaeon]